MEQNQMKAHVEVAPGEWECRTVPRPLPGDGQLLLRMRVCAVGVSEDSPGHGFFGVVEELGSDVDDFAVGDRVAAYIGEGDCFAEYVCVAAEDCCQLSEELDDYTSAFVAPLAHILRTVEMYSVPLAKPCVIEGGHMLRTALACARGLAPVIAVVHGENERAAAKKVGADYAIDAETCGDCASEVASILGDQQPALVIRGDASSAEGTVPWSWQDAVTLLTYRRVDPKPLYTVAVPMEDLQSALDELRSPDGPVYVFLNTSLKSRFTFPAYREPMSATIKP